MACLQLMCFSYNNNNKNNNGVQNMAAINVMFLSV